MINSATLENAPIRVLFWVTNSAVKNLSILFLLPLTGLLLLMKILKVWFLLRLMAFSVSIQLNLIGKHFEICKKEGPKELLNYLPAISDGLNSVLEFASDLHPINRLIFSDRLQKKLEMAKEKCDDYIEVLEISFSPLMHDVIEDAIHALSVKRDV